MHSNWDSNLYFSHLFRDKNGWVVVLSVDFAAKSDELQQVDAKSQEPQNQLPVAQLVQEACTVLK